MKTETLLRKINSTLPTSIADLEISGFVHRNGNAVWEKLMEDILSEKRCKTMFEKIYII